jgi:putative mRNA 3-end processing factor
MLFFTPSGIYCPAADVFIDPWKPENKAIITHAHSDHARWGQKWYLAHKDSEQIMRLRLGEQINLETVEYGHQFRINSVKFSLHPAGHILGSAQVRIESGGEVWVVSGDYKRQNDNFSGEFEPVKCHTFITESTFGLPIYRWQEQSVIFNEIKTWWTENRLRGLTSVLFGYSLGKMQRIITNLQPFDGNVFAHGAVYAINERLRNAGYHLPFIPAVSSVTSKEAFKESLILAPMSAMNSPWMKKFQPYSTANCSGWMRLRGAKNRMSVDRGFVLSDHADWDELNETVRETEAEKVFVTHGYTTVYSQWLKENNIPASEVETMFGNEDESDLVQPEVE